MFINIANSDRDSYLRYEIIRFFGGIQSEKTIKFLKTFLEENKNKYDDISLLAATIESLGELRITEMADTFMELVWHPDSNIVGACIVALARLEYPPAIDIFRQLSIDPRPFVFGPAIGALISLGNILKIDVEGDIKALLDNENQKIRHTAEIVLKGYQYQRVKK